MAGTLTHYCVMKKYYEEKENKTIPFNLEDPILAAGFLGSTGPDMFYMRDYATHIADFHHYKNPGLFVKNIYDNNKNDTLALNFAKGFLAHMATDLVTHPFVNSLVGKYQEHIITGIEIPGNFIPGPNDQRLSKNFEAHNMVEFAQDYYVQTYIFKINKYRQRVGSMFTHAIEEKYNDMKKIISNAIKTTYDIDIDDDDMKSVLNFFCDKYQISDIQDHVDFVIEDEYKNYRIFLEHINDIGMKKDIDTVFHSLLDKSIDLTHKMVKEMEADNWENILKPWNLDTGLYTKVDVKDNKIKINFDSYQTIY